MATDATLHGVERVTAGLSHLPRIGQKTRLHFCGENSWELRESTQVLATFLWSQIRYSIASKAYCFADEQSESLWKSGADALSTQDILGTLKVALRERGLLKAAQPNPTELALLLVDTFVKFPTARG